MKIAIDGNILDKINTAGKGRFAREIISALIKINKTDEIVVINKKTVSLPGGTLARARAMGRYLHEQNFDLFFEPTSFLPAIFSPVPTILVVHDLAVFLDPFAKPKLRTKIAEKLLLKKAVAKATRIVVPSESTKIDLNTVIANIPVGKITVVKEGVGEAFLKKVETNEIVKVKKYYGLKGKYILFVGTIEPRKNIAGLIEAYKKLPETIQSEYQLVLAGGLGWSHKKELKGGQGLIKSGKMKLLGYVKDDALPAVVTGASVFVYPSFSEGFGLPVIEAQSCLVAVVTSNISACQEAAGDGALLVDPKDTNAILRAIEKIITDQTLAKNLVKKGYENQKQYRWEKVAKKLTKVFCELN